MQDESRTPTLGMWKEFLSLITFQENCGVPSYDMWMMIDDHILKHLPIHLKYGVLYEQALVYVNSIVSIDGGNILEDIDISAFYDNDKFKL